MPLLQPDWVHMQKAIQTSRSHEVELGKRKRATSSVAVVPGGKAILETLEKKAQLLHCVVLGIVDVVRRRWLRAQLGEIDRQTPMLDGEVWRSCSTTTTFRLWPRHFSVKCALLPQDQGSSVARIEREANHSRNFYI